MTCTAVAAKAPTTSCRVAVADATATTSAVARFIMVNLEAVKLLRRRPPAQHLLRRVSNHHPDRAIGYAPTSQKEKNESKSVLKRNPKSLTQHRDEGFPTCAVKEARMKHKLKQPQRYAKRAKELQSNQFPSPVTFQFSAKSGTRSSIQQNPLATQPFTQ